MDENHLNGEWSVERVLQVVIANTRSWRGDGMKARIYVFLLINILVVAISLSEWVEHISDPLFYCFRLSHSCGSLMRRSCTRRSSSSPMSGSLWYHTGCCCCCSRSSEMHAFLHVAFTFAHDGLQVTDALLPMSSGIPWNLQTITLFEARTPSEVRQTSCNHTYL